MDTRTCQIKKHVYDEKYIVLEIFTKFFCYWKDMHNQNWTYDDKCHNCAQSIFVEPMTGMQNHCLSKTETKSLEKIK